MVRKESDTLGDLSGGWAALQKLTLILTPLIFTAMLAWSVWVTGAIYNLKRFDTQSAINRFSVVERKQILADIVDLKISVKTLKSGAVPEIPPAWFANKVDRMESTLRDNSRMLIELQTKVGMLIVQEQ